MPVRSGGHFFEAGLVLIPTMTCSSQTRDLSSQMNYIRKCYFPFLFTILLLPLTTGCGGDESNTVIQPGELTAEQEAEMAGLADQLNESMNRSPSNSGKSN